jgi:hypothetical protein
MSTILVFTSSCLTFACTRDLMRRTYLEPNRQGMLKTGFFSVRPSPIIHKAQVMRTLETHQPCKQGPFTPSSLSYIDEYSEPNTGTLPSFTHASQAFPKTQMTTTEHFVGYEGATVAGGVGFAPPVRW